MSQIMLKDLQAGSKITHIQTLVSLAAVFSVVTQRSCPQKAVCGEERCVTTLKTAARETENRNVICY